jgi:tetratricopeptide (TPR) repeat protein
LQGNDPLIAPMDAKRQGEQQELVKEGETAKGDSERPARASRWTSRAWAVCKSAWALITFGSAFIKSAGLIVLGGGAFVIVGLILGEAIFERTISIEPIGAPNDWVQRGYTPEAAAERLRASLTKTIKAAQFRNKQPPPAPSAQIDDHVMAPGSINYPDKIAKLVEKTRHLPALKEENSSVIVPMTGLSIETIAAQFRKLFNGSNHWTVAGGITSEGTGQIFRLVVSNDTGVTQPVDVPSDGDKDLFDLAAERVIEITDPLLLPMSWLNSDQDKSLELAKEIDPENMSPDSETNTMSAVHNLIGTLRLAQKEDAENVNKAIEEFNTAISLEGKPAPVLAALLSIERRLGIIEGDMNAASAHMHLSLALMKQFELSPDVSFNSDEEKDRQRNIDQFNIKYKDVLLKAITEFDRAVILDPKSPDAHSERGDLLFYLSTLSIQKDGRNISNDRRNYAIVEQLDKAVAEFRSAIDLTKKTPDLSQQTAKYQGQLGFALFLNGQILDVMGKSDDAASVFDQAVAAFEKGITLDRTDCRGYFGLTAVHADRGEKLLRLHQSAKANAEFDQAIDTIRKLGEVYPTDPKVYFFLGSVFENYGDALQRQGGKPNAIDEYAKASGEFCKAIHAKPMDPSFRMALCESLAKQERPAEAAILYKTAINLGWKGMAPPSCKGIRQEQAPLPSEGGTTDPADVECDDQGFPPGHGG